MVALIAIYQIYIQGKSIKKMYGPSNTEKFWELFYHTIFISVVALLKKTKEIQDIERSNQTDINKEQTNIKENNVNQEKVEHIEEYNPMDTSKLETQEQNEEHTNNEENVVNQEKGVNTED